MECKENYVDGYTKNFIKMGYDLTFVAKTSYAGNETDYRIKDNAIIIMNLVAKYTDTRTNYVQVINLINETSQLYGVNKIEASIILKKEVKRKLGVR